MTRIVALSAALFVAAMISGSKADAAVTTVTCTVQDVYFDGNRVIVGCNGTLYYGFVSSSNGCATSSLDTMKIWISMLSGQLLSGKPAELNVNSTTSTCGSQTLVSVKTRVN